MLDKVSQDNKSVFSKSSGFSQISEHPFIEKAVNRVIREYGETLKALGRYGTPPRELAPYVEQFTSLMSSVQVSVIILSYNTRDLLRECLESLVKISTGQNEIIVVDNASPDGSAQVVEQEFPQVKLIGSSRNLGFAAGNNLGARSAQGEFLFFLNSDTRIEDPEIFNKMISYLQQNPEIGIVAPQLINPDGSLQKSGRNLPTFWRELCYYSGLWRLSPEFFSNFFDFSKHKDFTKIQEVEDAGGAAIMIRHSLFEKLGGWDERFFMYYEDADLNKRVWQAGFRVVYFPEVKVIHYQGQSEKVTPGADRYLWESLPKYAKKWWPRWQTELLKLFLGFKKNYEESCLFNHRS